MGPNAYREPEIVRQTLIAVERMKKNGDCITEEGSGKQSPFLYKKEQRMESKTFESLFPGFDEKKSLPGKKYYVDKKNFIMEKWVEVAS